VSAESLGLSAARPLVPGRVNAQWVCRCRHACSARRQATYPALRSPRDLPDFTVHHWRCGTLLSFNGRNEGEGRRISANAARVNGVHGPPRPMPRHGGSGRIEGRRREHGAPAFDLGNTRIAAPRVTGFCACQRRCCSTAAPSLPVPAWSRQSAPGHVGSSGRRVPGTSIQQSATLPPVDTKKLLSHIWQPRHAPNRATRLAPAHQLCDVVGRLGVV